MPIPDLPPGVTHYNTQGFAESHEAYDVLTPEDGWTERSFIVDEGTEGERLHRSKSAVVDGFKFIVYPLPIA